MSVVETEACLPASSSPSGSLSVGVSVPATGSVVRNSALGVSYDNGAESSASHLLRSVKQGVESEEDGRKRKGKAGGGGKKDKGARFVNANNKHLIKKGILELDSTTRVRHPNSSSTLPPSLSLNSHQSDISCRPMSFCAATADTATVNESSETLGRGVLVAGTGGSMRMLKDFPDEYRTSPYLVSSQAFSPDSGYGNTPDTLKHDEQQQSMTNGMTTVERTAVTGSTFSHSASDRTSSSDSVAVTTAATATNGDCTPSFCGGKMSLPHGGKFGVGEVVNTSFPVPSGPVSSVKVATLDSEGKTAGNTSSVLSDSSSSTVVQSVSHQHPHSAANTPHHDSPFSGTFPLSPGPSESAQHFHFPGENKTPPTTARTHKPSPPHPSLSLSIHPSLTHLNRTSPRHAHSGRESPDGTGIRRPQVSTPTQRELKERRRNGRSMSQPLTATLDVHRNSTGGQKDYFQVSDELSRENSHFFLSEALLTIMEQFKANNTETVQEVVRGERGGQMMDYSDTSQEHSSLSSTPPPPRSWGSLSSIATDESTDAFVLQKGTPKISLLEVMQCSGNAHSAESTAQRLLQFIATQYSGVEPEDMTSTQTVLALPVDFLSSLKQDENLQKSVTTSTMSVRGSKDWAPPRPQIIFHIKNPSRNGVAGQGYRCAGCGMKQEPTQSRSFRFCNYTGKYFCQKCHTNASAMIPAYILDRWSFKKHFVSNFAHDLLERIHYEPVFDVQNINPQIYSTVPLLAQARDLRAQLVSVKKYLKTCRQAQSLAATFDGYIPWTADVHSYSVDDFLQMKLKMRYLKSLLSDAIKHVKSCPLCQGKGFVCEFCGSPEVIFPFELNKVSKCPSCHCCFHKQCFGNQPCPRCIRIRQREQRRQTQFIEEEDETLHSSAV